MNTDALDMRENDPCLTAELERLVGTDLNWQALPAADTQALLDAFGCDPTRLRESLLRRLRGEPVGYILGYIVFRGQHFSVNPQVYLTDPETTHLVDAVLLRTRELQAALGRPPVLVEFGLGCGSLAITIKREQPDVSLTSLEIDSGAIAIAQTNLSAHGVDVTVLQSDGFSAWGDRTPPDLIFGDPPWGDESSIYSDDRPLEHYLTMPAVSVFPVVGGKTGCHEQILREVRERGWPSEILLNGGVLPEEDLRRVGEMADTYEILHPALGISLLHCRMKANPHLST